MIKKRRWGATLLLSAGIFAVMAALWTAGVFTKAENWSYDLRVRLMADRSVPSDDIVVILLDQKSIERGFREYGWNWPWPRSAYGDLVDYMNTSGAASIVFDVLFTEDSVYGVSDDEAFAGACAEYGRAVQSVFFSSVSGNALLWPWNLSVPLFGGDFAGDDYAAQFPIDALLYSAGALGSVTVRADIDGVVRRAPLFTVFDNKAAPGLSAAALLASGKSNHLISGDGLLEWDGISVPVNSAGESLLRFKGTIDRYIPYSAIDVLDSAYAYRAGNEPLLFPEDFADKHVFFGFYAPGLFDIYSTPVSPLYPGVGAHVTMLDNLLSGDFIREPPWYTTPVMMLVMILCMIVLSLYSGKILYSMGFLIIVTCVTVLFGLGAYHFGCWVPIIAPLMAIFTAFVVSVVYNYYTEGSMRRFIKSAFSQYLSPHVIERLLENPDMLSLGGERKELSIFFSDIEGFTAVSEKLDPELLTELLNEYLSLVSDIILESGGTIDKYQGDAVIAFWNAPAASEDHAARALTAALECRRMLDEKKYFFDRSYGVQLNTRIGLNTGPAIVGNMGSARRFDYTMIGDSVNIAARLEGLNKQFGTVIMCTQATLDAARAHGNFFARKLALVAVTGRAEPVAVYEPMTSVEFMEREECIRAFEDALTHFYAGDFASALEIFEPLAQEDRPSFYYAEKCRFYISKPGDWPGYWQSAGK